MTGKGFIYSDKEELKESAAKILYLSHKQLHLRPSTLVKHTIPHILYVKDLAIECEESQSSLQHIWGSTFPPTKRESNLLDPVSFIPIKSRTREHRAQGMYSTVSFSGAGPSHFHLHSIYI